MSSSTLFRSLAENQDPCLSIYMPTHRHGNETLSDSSRFKTLLNSAAKKLADKGLTTGVIRSIIEPIEDLVSPSDFWQNRTEGLAIFAGRDFCQHLSLPHSVTEGVHIAPHFYLRQAVPYLTDDARFFVLALSKNGVRLFQGDQQSLTPMNLPGGPASMEEALQFEDPERQLQMRSVGGGNLSFHGHGAGEELDKESLERYFRAVDKSVVAALHLESAPLVLAAVPYYLPLYSSITAYPKLFGEAVEGNADHLGDKDLHRSASHLLASHFESERLNRTRRVQDLVGTGLVTDDLSDVVDAAVSGRVHALLLSSGQPSDNADEESLVNEAIVATLSHGGAVEMNPDRTTSSSSVRALLRF